MSILEVCFMALYQSQIRDIISRHTGGEKRILTWRGWRKIKLLDKTAALQDIYRAFGREFEEQRKVLDDELAILRQDIEAAKEKSESDLVASAPGYVFEELRTLFKELERELEERQGGQAAKKLPVLEKIHAILKQDHEEQFQIVDRAEKDAKEDMERFRRRLERMAKDLRLSEAEVARLRGELDAAYDSGVASVYKTVQGLSGNDSRTQSKRALLSKLFESNLELRKNISYNREIKT
jgi:hypothetical protein